GGEKKRHKLLSFLLLKVSNACFNITCLVNCINCQAITHCKYHFTGLVMGSEGPPAVTIHVTGFKKFHGVSENPTETIVSNLKEYMKKKGFPKGLILGSCSILETAGQGAIAPLYQTLQSAVSEKDSESSSSKRIIWLHFGVNSGAARFAIEHQAVNEATFRCPDEMGWKPQKVPIIPADGGISRVRQTSLPCEAITKALAKKGFEVMTSDDAGRFVCNYVYYHSLRFAEQSGTKSLFVHVPLFVTIDEETQMQFVASLLEVNGRFNDEMMNKECM
ncbi:Peptidase_C15 domain-containing protein, partial [Cephalotus follicularis]